VTILPAISQPTLGITLSENAHKYLLNSKSKRTRQGYRSDLKYFAAFCQSQSVLPLPAAPATVAAYLVMLAEGGFKPATIRPA
jgi:site-specific recombinase XerD